MPDLLGYVPSRGSAPHPLPAVEPQRGSGTSGGRPSRAIAAVACVAEANRVGCPLRHTAQGQCMALAPFRRTRARTLAVRRGGSASPSRRPTSLAPRRLRGPSPRGRAAVARQLGVVTGTRFTCRTYIQGPVGSSQFQRLRDPLESQGAAQSVLYLLHVTMPRLPLPRLQGSQPDADNRLTSIGASTPSVGSRRHVRV